MAFPIYSGFNFSGSFTNSQKIDTAKVLSPSASQATLWEKSATLNTDIKNTFGPNAPDFGALVGLDSTKFLGGVAWTFITAPEEVSWDISNQATRVDIFGTNNPPVISGSRGMRDLTLGNALVEGFVRNVSVEGKVAALEALMNYNLNNTDGFVSVPVYQIWANKKSYGGPEGYFIIKDVRVKETMRDIKGNSTRAYVDISLMQVPKYQVNTGRDLANEVTAGGTVRVNPVAQGGNSQANQKVSGTTANGGSTATNANKASGPQAGNAKPATAVEALNLNRPEQIIPRR